MFRKMFRVFFALAVALSLTFGAFSGGVSLAAAASQAPTDSGYNPVASTPPDMGYCYPSGYNRNGWRCGWRLAMAPYNLGDYNRYCGYGYGYGYNCYGYYPGWTPGTGGRQNIPVNGDFGGRPRFNPCYAYNPCYNYNYNPCYNTNYNTCYWPGY